jgi:hypothetical protein
VATLNQPLEREIAGAGWPFNRRVEDTGEPLPTGQDAPPTLARIDQSVQPLAVEGASANAGALPPPGQ